LAGYLLGNPYARIGLWPELAMDGWRGTPAAIHNRLMAMLGWTEPYYKDIASLLLRLALGAPSEAGPVRSFPQLLNLLDPELLVRLYEHDPDRHREARSLAGREQARAVAGAQSRFANFAHAVADGFDGGACGWSFEDVDFAYLRAPYLAGREDADACCRLQPHPLRAKPRRSWGRVAAAPPCGRLLWWAADHGRDTSRSIWKRLRRLLLRWQAPQPCPAHPEIDLTRARLGRSEGTPNPRQSLASGGVPASPSAAASPQAEPPLGE
jgi:hypothetical protein